MESNNHGNKREKWKIDYRNVTNDFLFQNVDIHQHYVLPVVRDAHMDLALYLRRLSASDDSMPVTIRNDTYRDMAKEIINKSDSYVFIRKGKWEKTQLQIKEDIEDLKIKRKLEEYLKSDKNFKDFIEGTDINFNKIKKEIQQAYDKKEHYYSYVDPRDNIEKLIVISKLGPNSIKNMTLDDLDRLSVR